MFVSMCSLKPKPIAANAQQTSRATPVIASIDLTFGAPVMEPPRGKLEVGRRRLDLLQVHP